MTDAPACGLDHVYVGLEKVRMHQSSTAQDADAGWTEVRLDPARRIDLLSLTNGALHELGTTALPTGTYAQMRLVLASNTAVTVVNAVQPTGGIEVALGVAPGLQQVSIPLAAGIEVAAGQIADLVLDFDACRSIVQAGTGGTFQLRPVVSVLPRAGGAIEGVVASALPARSTTVSAQRSGETVRSTQPDGSGRFSIPFLPAGTYTLVIAADGFATGAITGVPVKSGTTAVSTTAAAISLPRASMGEITGDVAASTAPGEVPAERGAVTDAEVRAIQTLASGEPIEVRSRPVDSLLGQFRINVPQGAPWRAAYAASAPLAFARDTGDGGVYSLDVRVRDGAEQPTP
jgi:hypothetical protein